MAAELTATHADLVAEQWSTDFFRFGLKNMFFSRFIGSPMKLNYVGEKAAEATILTDPNALIQMKMDLTVKKGEAVTYPIIYPLSSQGQVNGTIEDNEEGIDNYAYRLAVKDFGHGVRDSGPLDRQKAAFEWDPVCRQTLALWFAWAVDRATYLAMSGLLYNGANDTALVAASAPSRKLAMGTGADGALTVADTDAEILADDVFSLDCVDFCKRYATASEPIIRPIMVDGQPKYLMFLHPLQVKALKASDDYKNLHFYTSPRDHSNPLKSGAIGEYDGVILHQYDRCETRLGEGGETASEEFEDGDAFVDGVYAARALFCGAQAACHAYASKPKFHRKDFDYGRNHGTAVDVLMGIGRPEFNSVDYGVMTVDTAIVADTVS
jgi:N4-gp56 family major capsid protein